MEKFKSIMLTVIGILFLVSLAVNIVWGCARGNSNATIDLTSTIDKLSAENKQLREFIAGFENERSETYKRFEDAISGAGGDVQSAIDTVRRIEEISERIGN